MTADVYEPHPHSHRADARTLKATTVEAGTVEAGTVEAGTVEAGTVEAGTVEATVPDGSAQEHAGWQARLRDRGYRLTPQRQLVLEAVARLGHATPETIVTEVRRTASGVNISTVYRTLDLLEDLGLVWHVHLTHGAPTYHVTGQHRHIHLVCGRCGAIDEISPDRLTGLVGELRQERGFQVDVDHVALTGRCADCSAAARG